MFFTGDVRPTTSRHLTTSVSTEPQTTISFPCVLMPRKQRKYVRVNLRPNRARSTLTRPHLNTPYIHGTDTPHLIRPEPPGATHHASPRGGTEPYWEKLGAFTPPLWAEFHTRPTEAIVQPDAASSCQANPTFSTSATFAIEQWEPFTGLPVHV
ncbi:hypothetical protein CABS01_12195 [Colletotrichum abscissum]|uniref:uncharacterized protein n=1 Tax=Colletotrichum abscissum TaxID=1671311 RepID=UPI0027D4824C|nr:uncharacterized protein CABS01_12195 [Colletotrichum abscissum]KAK1491102.1 hypothetical protein CABS01_12195 [Colletotrichum abscissum]